MTDEKFIFELTPQYKYSDADILQNLIGFSEETKSDRITTKEYDQWINRIVSSGTIIRRFGSWKNAIKLAGFANKTYHNPTLDPDEMVQIFMNCCKEIGNLPSKKQLGLYLGQIESSYSVNSYVSYFGGLKRIMSRLINFEAGKLTKKELLQRHQPNKPDPLLRIPENNKYDEKMEFDAKRRKYSKNEIIDILKKFYEKTNFQPFSSKEFQKWKQKPISSVTIIDIFGSWPQALKEAGIKPKRVFKRNPVEMIKIFKDCWQELKRPPTHKELDEYLKKELSPYTSKSFIHFGGIRRLAERIVDFNNSKMTEQDLYSQHIPNRYRKPIPLKTRYQILERDNNRCVKCGATAKESKLEVDHIVPVSQGGDDSHNNLQTMCWECNRGKKDRFNT